MPVAACARIHAFKIAGQNKVIQPTDSLSRLLQAVQLRLHSARFTSQGLHGCSFRSRECHRRMPADRSSAGVAMAAAVYILPRPCPQHSNIPANHHVPPPPCSRLSGPCFCATCHSGPSRISQIYHQTHLASLPCRGSCVQPLRRHLAGECGKFPVKDGTRSNMLMNRTSTLPPSLPVSPNSPRKASS